MKNKYRIGELAEIVHTNERTIFGIVSDENFGGDLLAFEKQLKKLTQKSPHYLDIGHNHGLIHVYSEGYLKKQDDRNLFRFILPVQHEYKGKRYVSKYKLGSCLKTYHHGRRSCIGRTLDVLNRYIHQNKIIISGEVIISAIAGSFIIKDPNQHLYEIKIPIKQYQPGL